MPASVHNKIRPAIRLTEGARRRVAMLRWACLGFALCGIALLLADYVWFHSKEPAPSVRIFLDTLWWSLVAYVGATLLVDRVIHTPTTEGTGWVLFGTSVAFLLLLLFYATIHAAYSRLALLLGFGVTTLWLLLGARLHVRGHVLRLGVCEAAVMERLNAANEALAANVTRVQIQLTATTNPDELALLDGVIIDRYSVKDEAMQRLVTRLKLDGARIYSADYVHELLTGRISLQHTEDSFLDDSSGQILYVALKRVLDSIGAALLLVLLGVPLLLTALAVRLESRGPALFVQPRVGLGGRPFQMLKFRTMQLLNEQDHNLDHDSSRITPLGQWLRHYRIDELPQLINILKGEMSLIGPRPEWTETAQDFFARIPHYPYRHLVRPGITGWAQVHQGHVVGIYDAMLKLELDLYYVKHLSLALDLVITIRTIRTLLTGFGAR